MFVNVSICTSPVLVVLPVTSALPPIVKLFVIVTLSGNPICKVWLLAEVSISFAVPETVRFCVSRLIIPVPASPKKFRLTRAVINVASVSTSKL